MPIYFEHSMTVDQSPDRVFGVLDDVSQTPRWLARCTGIEQLTPGENAVGSKFRYSYRDGRRSGTMVGTLTARVPNERLTFTYADGMTDVVVDFRLDAADAGTRLTHAITITPKTLPAKLASPIIRKQLPKQTIAAMESLRGLLAAGPAAA